MGIRDFCWKGVHWIDLRERNHSKDLVVDGRITLEWVLRDRLEGRVLDYLRERDHLKDLGVDDRITLEWILKTSVGRACT